MKTPMQELFYRLEQLRFAKDPVSEIFKIKEVMLDKEKDAILSAYNNFELGEPEDYYRNTFK